MKNCKNRRLALVGLNVLLFFFFSVTALQASEESPVVTNVTGGQFTVSWTTSQLCAGKVSLYDNAGFIRDCYDDRGKDFKSTTHYVTVNGLKENTAYAFAIDSGGTLDDNEGNLYQVTTGANLIPVGSIQPAGKVFLTDADTPAVGAIVYVTIWGSQGVSAPLSTLVDGNGYWFLELVNARATDHQKLFNISVEHDKLVISVDGGEKGSAYLENPIIDNQGGTRLYPPFILR